MENKKIKICAKGSRKTGQAFMNETNYLSTIVDCIEIDFNYPHDTNFSREISYLKKLRKKTGINFTVHAQYLSGGLNDFNKIIREETIKQAFKSIDYANELGAKIVTLHPALEPYGLKIKKMVELEIEAYKKISAYAKKRNIKVGLENEAQTCFWFPDRACKINLLSDTIKKIKSPNFGLTLDIGHANVSGENYLEAIKKYHGKILHIHAHDNSGEAKANLAKFKRPDPHLAPGKGNIQWKKVIDLLKKIEYKGYFELECEINDMAEAIKYIKAI